MKKYLLIFLIALTTHGISQNTFPASGNVGIGTTAPLVMLHVVGEELVSRIYASGNNLINPTDPYAADIVIGSDRGGTRHDGSIMFWSSGSASRILNQGDVFNFSVWASANPNVALAATVGATSYFQGALGIGTTSPGPYKLAVEGTIGARKIKVTQVSPWSDYVFDSSYQLQPLTELEKFIKNNKHLPDVPSAKEVEKEGIDLGENQAVLLKKIEELTLYVIEMKKEMQVLQKENAQQKIAIQQLQSK